jgi:O-antigen/teichoic acid export membrane protein
MGNNIANKIKQYIMQSDFLKSVSVLFSGNLIANAISFASIPIISRIYSQEAFGEYAVMTSLATIIITIVSFGMTSAIMAPRDDHEAKEILTIVGGVEVVLIATISLGFIILSQYVKILNVSLGTFYSSVLFFFYSVVLGLFYLLAVLTNKQRLNRVLFWNALINALAMFVLAIPLGLLGMKGDGLMVAAIISYLVADIQMIWHTHPFVFINKNRIIYIIKKYKDFIFYQYPSNLVGSFAQQYPNQFFSNQFGNASLGGYAMCERILGVPMRLIGSPINTVYFRHASIYTKEGRDLSAFTFKLISILLAISFLPILILFICSEPLFTFILGEEWTEVGNIVSILIIPYFLSFCCNCITYCLVVIDKQRVNLVLTIVQFVLVGGALMIGLYLSQGFMYILTLYAWALIIYHVFHLLAIFYYLRKHFFRFCSLILLYIVAIYSIRTLLTEVL